MLTPFSKPITQQQDLRLARGVHTTCGRGYLPRSALYLRRGRPLISSYHPAVLPEHPTKNTG